MFYNFSFLGTGILSLCSPGCVTHFYDEILLHQKRYLFLKVPDNIVLLFYVIEKYFISLQLTKYTSINSLPIQVVKT